MSSLARRLAWLEQSFDIDCVKLLDRMTVKPNRGRRALLNRLVRTLKASGIWDKLDYLYCLAAADEQSASLNILGTSYSLTKVSSPSFRTSRGYRSAASSGSGNALDTGFNPTTGSPKATQDDCHVGFWSLSNANVTINDMGNSLTTLMARPTTLTVRLNSASPFNVAVTSGAGHFIANRLSSSQVETYKDGASLGVTANASTTPTNRTHWLCGRNHTSAEYGVRELAFAHGGKRLTADQVTILYNAMLAFLTAVVPVIEVAVSPGTGTIQAAVNALAAEGPTKTFNRYVLKLSAGVYNEVDLLLQDFIDIEGAGSDQTEVRCWQAADLDPSSVGPIALNSGINWKTSNRLSKFKVSVKNARYCIHADGANIASVQFKIKLAEDLVLEHLGNQEAIDYQTGIGGSPNLVWSATDAFGGGSSSGEILIMRRCTMLGGRSGFAYHTIGERSGIPVTAPVSLTLEGCDMDGTYSMYLRPYGSLQLDTLTTVNCRFRNKPIWYNADRWYPSALANQPADHSEIKVTMQGNIEYPGSFTVTDWGRSLRIDSAAGKTVALGGSAASILLGTVTAQGSYAYGSADVSGHSVGPSDDLYITSMEARLGDSTGNPKQLVVTFGSDTPITVTFAADYSASAADTVKGLINTALSGQGTASYFGQGNLYAPTILS